MIEQVRRFTVYGLRLQGEKEVRYIGQTNGFPALRLANHFNAAALRRHNPELCDWLLQNEQHVEVFKIGYADTREEARGIERAIIALCQRLDHRLFNLRPGRPSAQRKAA